MKDSYYEIVDSMASENEVIQRAVKTQTLNVYKNKIDQLERSTLDVIVLNALSSLSMVIEDAYKIDLYKYQFHLLVNSLSKELKNIEEIIQFSNE